MILQLTPEELEKFAKAVSKWHYDCITYIFEHFNIHSFPISNTRPNAQFRDLRIRFEKQNPQPDWKSLI